VEENKNGGAKQLNPHTHTADCRKCFRRLPIDNFGKTFPNKFVHFFFGDGYTIIVYFSPTYPDILLMDRRSRQAVITDRLLLEQIIDNSLGN
jgi:hypothetical protein